VQEMNHPPSGCSSLKFAVEDQSKQCCYFSYFDPKETHWPGVRNNEDDHEGTHNPVTRTTRHVLWIFLEFVLQEGVKTQEYFFFWKDP
jgi:hypothetical protein